MNFRGPLRIDLETEVLAEPEGDDAGVAEQRLRFFATEAASGDEVEVELRVGRGGVVFALPLDQSPEPEPGELPPNEDLRPVPPEARTTPLSVADFTHHE